MRNLKQWDSERVTDKSKARFINALPLVHTGAALSALDFYKHKSQREILVSQERKTDAINTFLLVAFSQFI